MSALAERIDEALRIVRATLGTKHEDAARADLAVQVAAARKEQAMAKVHAKSTLVCDAHECGSAVSGSGSGATHDEALRAARRRLVIVAEICGWSVSPHGATLDLCPVHKHLAVPK